MTNNYFDEKREEEAKRRYYTQLQEYSPQQMVREQDKDILGPILAVVGVLFLVIGISFFSWGVYKGKFGSVHNLTNDLQFPINITNLCPPSPEPPDCNLQCPEINCPDINLECPNIEIPLITCICGNETDS